MGTAHKQIAMYAKYIVRIASLFAYTSVFLLARPAFADDARALCQGDALAQLFCGTSISTMLNAAFSLSITLGGILAMLRIGYAGWLYMGRDFDNWSSKQKAKETFRDAIMGLLVLLAIYLILYQINPNILKLQILGVNS